MVKKMLKILFVASELTPLAKVGGLGDVIGSLPKALAELGVDVRVIIPLYEQIKKNNLKLVIGNWKLENGERVNIYKTRLPRQHSNILQNVRMLPRNDGVEVFLIYNKKYLSKGPIYFEKTAFAGSKKEIDRFKFFSQAVYQLLARISVESTRVGADNSAKSAFGQHKSAISGWRPDIVHCNDWHTGALVKALREVRNEKSEMRPKTIFTIHNLANQGATKRENLMAEGIKNADVVTTVSPTYAREILTQEYGAGLEGLLVKRRKNLVGILNGVDYGFWPKKHARQDNIPTFGLVSRLTYQKGIDLVTPLVSEFVRKCNAQFWFLGQGETQYEKALQELAKKYPRNVFAKIGFDEKLAHKIYRESDFFLMPSRFEPSGLGQMISMHYGTIPIVRATGGLKDSVRHLKTGFVFKNASSADLRKVMHLAARYFYDKKKFAVIRKNCLKRDFSWFKSAKEYKKIYARLMAGITLSGRD